ncbi:Angiotensin-converting enzyme [Orchesella cincta]|uniref:Angiotensin-converting enzyme n=1 Tax=Orchesella cincta TaxID=48709 RepID=A0A1D2NEA6_ORCCI|nr:Angiotensin-converting enzyme [Orchesella cincta]
MSHGFTGSELDTQFRINYYLEPFVHPITKKLTILDKPYPTPLKPEQVKPFRTLGNHFNVSVNFSLTESDALKFLNEVEPIYRNMCTMHETAGWEFAIDMSEENSLKAEKAKSQTIPIASAQWKQQAVFPWETYKNQTIRRIFKKLGESAHSSALPVKTQQELDSIIEKMGELFSSATVCPYNKKDGCDLGLMTDIVPILGKARDYEEGKYYWTAWHDAVKGVGEYYPRYVEIVNERARLNGFKNAMDDNLSLYETNFLHLKVHELLGRIYPLYEQLHAYARRKLREFYRDHQDEISEDGPIPIHVTGDMYAQRWHEIYDILVPYPELPNIDVSDEMQNLGYTPRKMYEDAEEFFQSIGFPPLRKEFWELSIFEKVPGKIMNCHPSAREFCDRKSFRILMCTQVTMFDYAIIHHEVGHIYHFSQYSDRHVMLLEGANQGFDEAIGDTIAFSVKSPKHLMKKGLLKNFTDDEPNRVKNLMQHALTFVMDIPWMIALEQWRWDVWSGQVEPRDYNCHWWKLRQHFQGVKPSSSRKTSDFDPASKHHIANNVQYINYFIARILTFQFHEALCITAKQYDPEDPLKPLYNCDIYGSKEAGKQFSDMLRIGSSVPWQDALEIVTGTRNLDPEPLLNYYKPFLTETEALTFLQDIDHESRELSFKKSSASWEQDLDMASEEKAKLNSELIGKRIAYNKELWKRAAIYPWETFRNRTIRRVFKSLLGGGNDALPDKTQQELNEIGGRMSKIYSTATVCPYNKDGVKPNEEECTLTQSDVESKLAEAEDYKEAKYYWKVWHDAVKDIGKDYPRFVEILNEAAILNDYPDAQEYYMAQYETDFLNLRAHEIMGRVYPLYEQLHAYARRKLRTHYKDHEGDISEDGPIPIHVFKNLYAQKWLRIYDILVPYPELPKIDIGAEMERQGYTPKKMFEDADDFYQSIGFEKLRKEFWETSVIERDPEKQMACHATAWDMSDRKSFRIRMCTKVEMSDYITIFHELGHVHYYMQYANRHTQLAEGANPGFHEAIGDTIAFSINSVSYLQKMGLLSKEYKNVGKHAINQLLLHSLSFFVDTPWVLSLEQWRWDVLAGKIKPKDYNCHWWKLRHHFQGVTPSTSRKPSDFDPASKYHIPNDAQYINYFVAKILTFQFHEALCIAAKQYDPDDPSKPLHDCSIYGSKEAGKQFADMLRIGSSVPWQDALEIVTGVRDLNAEPILNYYKPLYDWLVKENAKYNETVGWQNLHPDVDYPFCEKED